MSFFFSRQENKRKRRQINCPTKCHRTALRRAEATLFFIFFTFRKQIPTQIFRITPQEFDPLLIRLTKSGLRN